MENKLTQDELKRQLDYVPLTGIFKWKVSNSNRVQIGDIAGCKNKDGYIVVRINKRRYYAHRLAWLYVYGYFPENQIDHKYRNPSNNKIDNLREVSQTCNLRNQNKYKNNKSGVTGVSWSKELNKWYSQIAVNKKIIYLGIYINLLDAAISRWNAEVKYNFPNCNTTSSAFLYIQKHNKPLF